LFCLTNYDILWDQFIKDNQAKFLPLLANPCTCLDPEVLEKLGFYHEIWQNVDVKRWRLKEMGKDATEDPFITAQIV
jgi:hypothetical protein